MLTPFKIQINKIDKLYIKVRKDIQIVYTLK